MPIGDVLPEIVLLVGALAGVMLASFTGWRRQPHAAWCALLVIAVALGLSLHALAGPAHASFSGTWAVDGVTGGARVLILLATAVSVMLAPEWLRSDRRQAEYHAVLLLSALGAMLLAGASDTLEVVVAVLLSSITAYTLCAWHRDWPLSVEAGMKLFLVGALANVFLLIGVVVLFGLVGSTGYAETAAALAGTSGVDGMGLRIAVAGICVGLAFELAAVPAHAWMPDAAEGAPAPAAAFLSVVPKVGAAIALARFLALVPEAVLDWRPLLALMAVASMTLGNLAALRQRDVRRLLGWSTVAQSGYALVAVTLVGRSDEALPALLFFLAGYAAANLAAFGVVTELRGRTALEDYAGLVRERPLLVLVLGLAFLSLVGIPPLAGFVGKLLLYLVAIDGGYAWLAGAIVANTVVSLFYYVRVLAVATFEIAPTPVPLLGRWAAVATGVAAFATVAVGLAAEALLAPLRDAVLLP